MLSVPFVKFTTRNLALLRPNFIFLPSLGHSFSPDGGVFKSNITLHFPPCRIARSANLSRICFPRYSSASSDKLTARVYTYVHFKTPWSLLHLFDRSEPAKQELDTQEDLEFILTAEYNSWIIRTQTRVFVLRHCSAIVRIKQALRNTSKAKQYPTWHIANDIRRFILQTYAFVWVSGVSRFRY